MDFEEKAKAIWAALDEMAEKNPDSYRQFINEQLQGEGAQDMWKQLGFVADVSDKATTSTSNSKRSKLKGPEVVQTYRPNHSPKKRSFLTTSTGQLPSTSSKDAQPNQCSNSHATTMNLPSTSLLDDSFNHSTLLMNPLLAQIVADDEEDEELLADLKLPKQVGSGDNVSETGKTPSKPLIEEV